MTAGLTALVADDERLAREHLVNLLAEVPEVVCVGQASDGPDTVKSVEKSKPDLLFLDIEMPGLTGIQVLEGLIWQPRVIFTTAHDRYAVTAFELQAVDYLLKPFGRERLHKALAVVRREPTPNRRERGESLERARTAMSPVETMRRVFVRERGRIVPVNTAEILRLEARDDYVMLYTVGRSHLVSLRMRDFEARLDPERFLRIHRSHMVNLDYVTALEPCDGSRLTVRLSDGTAVCASRSRSKRLRQLVI